MAASCVTITEQWIREKLRLQHNCLADVRSLFLPGTYEGKISHLGISLKNFVRLKTLDLSYNALVSLEGLEHLKLLESLNLYYNRIPSLKNVLVLHKLQNLTELDLRLNPVVTRDPDYRLYLIHGLSKLRKLDGCPVRDRERRAALMFFSSEAVSESSEESHSSTAYKACRSSERRMALVNRMIKKLSVLDGNEETALNHVANTDLPKKMPGHSTSAQTYLHHEQESSAEIINLLNDYNPEIVTSSHNQGSYKRPMELLLGVVNEYCSEPREKHPHKSLLMNTVQIILMMEQDILSGEEEVQTLREKIEALNTQTELQEKEYKTEIQSLSTRLEEAHVSIEKLNQQFKSVLEDNVSLQKQLIRLEEKLLSSRMKKIPNSKDNGGRSEGNVLQKKLAEQKDRVQEGQRVKELADMLQESHKSLMATNTRLLQELKETKAHHKAETEKLQH
ncbi:centrosomal protein of 72 kDa [Chanos chanos]|uniref:Centrosomal protein of 72 kDa n=1 Tax=Chanos chanos TaxID=29144 RepID=A0A6J2W471_CHACN|nr:centrosomal protein of 72 kDa [Chanos chanos]